MMTAARLAPVLLALIHSSVGLVFYIVCFALVTTEYRLEKAKGSINLLTIFEYCRISADISVLPRHASSAMCLLRFARRSTIHLLKLLVCTHSSST